MLARKCPHSLERVRIFLLVVVLFLRLCFIFSLLCVSVYGFVHESAVPVEAGRPPGR